MTSLIGDLRNKIVAQPGESIRFEVTDVDQRPLEEQSNVVVRINGITGATQFLQFAEFGTHTVNIIAERRNEDGTYDWDKKSIMVEVSPRSEPARARAADQQAALPKAYPLLRAASQPGMPYTMSFSLIPIRNEATAELHSRATPDESDAYPAGTPINGLTQAATYTWNFGDGNMATTSTPSFNYDFTDSLEPTREQKTFHVNVAIKPEHGKPYKVTRSLSVINSYAICRKRGTIIPLVQQMPMLLSFQGGYSAVVAVTNIDTVTITLDKYFYRFQGLESASIAVSKPTSLSPSYEIAPSETAVIDLLLDVEQLPQDVSGVTLYLAGQSQEENLQVRAEAFFDLPFESLGRGAPMLDRVRESRSAVDTEPSPPLNVSLVDVRRFTSSKEGDPSDTLERYLDRLAAERYEGAQGRALDLQRTTRSERASRSPCQEGNECDPNSDGGSHDCECLNSGETREVKVPSCIVNAQKGDIVLLVGGRDSIISNMLRQVKPSQYFDHCFMVTKDALASPAEDVIEQQEVTHSTVSFERLMDERFFVGDVLGIPVPIHGVRPDVIRYIWPGCITQTTEEALAGMKQYDKETNKEYRLLAMAFTTQIVEQQGQWEITQPLVVKPDPLYETKDVRERLHTIADELQTLVGKEHYRLFNYTDARFDKEVQGDDNSWAAGTNPSMCSSILWKVIRKCYPDQHFEGQPEPVEVAQGVSTTGVDQDGLYHYTAEERLAAAEVVQNYVKQELYRLAGNDSKLFNDVHKAAEAVANQVINTFASDGAEDLSRSWQTTPRKGVTVSPQDIMYWDSPQNGGLYGYVAPVMIRNSYQSKIDIYRWKRVKGRGYLYGKVLYKEQPVENATLTIPGRDVQYSKADGSYRFEDLAVGTHKLQVSKTIDGFLREAIIEADVITTDNPLDIDLKSPWRRLRIKGRIHWRNRLEHGLDVCLNLSSLHPASCKMIECSGKQGELVSINANARWKSDQSLDVLLTCEARIYVFGLHARTFTSTYREQVSAGETINNSRWGPPGTQLFIDIALSNQEV